MSDNITLPREVVEKIHEAWSSEVYPPAASMEWYDIMDALRTALASPRLEVTVDPRLTAEEAAAISAALAAEQPKPEPVAWMDRFGSVVLGKGPYETFTTPLYTFPPDAPTVKESLTHPGYIIGSHWLETAYSRVCAGEAEADVLWDCGWERVDETLRRDAERYRWLRNEHSRIDPCIKANAKYRLERDSSTWVNIHDLDAAIDAAMGDKT